MKITFHWTWLHLGAAMLLAVASATAVPAHAASAAYKPTAVKPTKVKARNRGEEAQPTRLYDTNRLPKLNGSKGRLTYHFRKKRETRQPLPKCSELNG